MRPLSRRAVLGICLSSMLVPWKPAQAALTCENYFSGTEPKGSFDLSLSRDYPFVFSKQPDDFGWCWAACIENVLRYLGSEGITQPQIVKRIHGQVVDEGGNPRTAIEGRWTTAEGEEVQLETKMLWDVSENRSLRDAGLLDGIANTLCSNVPIIASYSLDDGFHAVLVVGVRGTVSADAVEFKPFHVFNPWGRFEDMSRLDFSNLRYLMTVLVS